MDNRGLVFIVSFAISTLVFAQNDQPSALSELLHNVQNKPVKVGVGIISTDDIEYNTAIDPLSSTVYFTRPELDFSKRQFMKSSFLNG